jgi:hypothetical protein
MKTFIKDVAERSIKTFAQVMLSFIGVEGLAFGDVDWIKALSVAGLAALASVLTSIISYNFTGNGTASLVKEK